MAIHSIVVVTILIPNEQVAVQFQTIFKSYRFIPMLLVVAIYFIKTYNFNSDDTSKSYQFFPMLMVVAILIPNKQLAIQFQTIL